MIKVYIADDHLLIREGLKKILNPEKDIFIIGDTGRPEEVLNFITEDSPDVVILDLNFPGVNGLDILKKIKELDSSINVLILSIHPEDKFAHQVLKAGASGYVSKESLSDEILKAIRKTAAGGKYISSSLAENFAENLDGEKREGVSLLSEREFQVFLGIANGKPQIKIAEELSLSPNTINTYRTRILEKLNLRNNADIIHYALKNKII